MRSIDFEVKGEGGFAFLQKNKTDSYRGLLALDTSLAFIPLFIHGNQRQTI